VLRAFFIRTSTLSWTIKRKRMPMLLLLLSMEKISTDDLSRSNGPGRPTNLIPKTIVLVENQKRMSAVSSVMKWVILHVIARKNKSAAERSVILAHVRCQGVVAVLVVALIAATITAIDVTVMALVIVVIDATLIRSVVDVKTAIAPVTAIKETTGTISVMTEAETTEM